jgi:NAD(P)H-quinone oxidoreductase subunit 5
MKNLYFAFSPLMPFMLMMLIVLLSLLPIFSIQRLWKTLIVLSWVALVFAISSLFFSSPLLDSLSWLRIDNLASGLILLVQLLGTVIASFSKRYLEGEFGQRRYVTALAAVLSAVHLLLLADHWLVLIAAWSIVGVALQHLLCFYSDRPFALLAAHKKRIADRVADLLLITAAGMAWMTVGSGSLSDLWVYIDREGMSIALHLCAICLVLAVILRTALLPVHGWLIQVMEAPTPVSALLHAGVVNLGGYILIRFSPLFEHAMPANALLIIFGLSTSILAGFVMLTRISIKVRLAWSTVAQMGFIILECGLGLYTLAILHLVGHSLYKAHAFLSASMIVRQTRLQTMYGVIKPTPLSLLLAPALAIPVVLLIQSEFSHAAWPWWWSVVLGLAWSPLLWLPTQHQTIRAICLHIFFGMLMFTSLTAAALLTHALPLGIQDTPHSVFGIVTLIGMLALYIFLAILQLRPKAMTRWRHWIYAGFYLDEVYTRFALQIWPTRWTPKNSKHNHLGKASLAQTNYSERSNHED